MNELIRTRRGFRGDVYTLQSVCCTTFITIIPTTTVTPESSPLCTRNQDYLSYLLQIIRPSIQRLDPTPLKSKPESKPAYIKNSVVATFVFCSDYTLIEHPLQIKKFTCFSN